MARLISVLRLKSYHDDLQAQNILLEQQLIQSQKMEVVGVLAEGMIKDFNIILTAIKVYSKDTSRYSNGDSKTVANQMKVNRACEHGKKIVQHILTFSKQKEESHELCNLSELIDKSLEMIRHTIPSHVKIEWEPPETKCLIQADATQIYQLLMNLCITTSQAMEHGRVLKISLTETKFDTNSAPSKQINHQGTYLKLEIFYPDKAIDLVHLVQFMNPISSTKKSEKGIGLSLFVVQRTVRNHGGFITVDCNHKEGTTFNVYFPSAQKENIIKLI